MLLLITNHFSKNFVWNPGCWCQQQNSHWLLQKVILGIKILKIALNSLSETHMFLASFSYLFVGVVIWVNVIVKLLVFIILFVTEFTVEVGLKIFQGFCYSVLFFSIILGRKNKKNPEALAVSLMLETRSLLCCLIIFVNICTAITKDCAYLLCHSTHIYYIR